MKRNHVLHFHHKAPSNAEKPCKSRKKQHDRWTGTAEDVPRHNRPGPEDGLARGSRQNNAAGLFLHGRLLTRRSRPVRSCAAGDEVLSRPVDLPG